MIYTAIDNFYLTDEQLKNSPSRKDGIDEATETTLRIYGCDLIQESGILLKLYCISYLSFCIIVVIYITYFYNYFLVDLCFLNFTLTDLKLSWPLARFYSIVFIARSHLPALMSRLISFILFFGC